MSMTPKLHVVKEGHGKPMLLVHGFGANRHTWDLVRPALAESHEVWAVDLKGFGDSPKPADRRYTIADQARLITALIQHHRLNHLTLVGHSMGGGVSLMAATQLLNAPANPIDRLILIDSPAYPQAFPWFIKIMRTPLINRLMAWGVPPRAQVKRVLREVFFDPNKITHQLIEAYAAPLRYPGARAALLQTAQEILPKDIDQRVRQYPQIRVPTLLIHGQHDTVIPLWVSQRLERDLPRATLKVIPDCGHAPQEEQPQQTLAAIEDFLRTG